jgi:hypothetical protein
VRHHGIHGLANKPPVDEKTRWWKAAIAEGLARNEGLADPELQFEFVPPAVFETPISTLCGESRRWKLRGPKSSRWLEAVPLDQPCLL